MHTMLYIIVFQVETKQDIEMLEAFVTWTKKRWLESFRNTDKKYEIQFRTVSRFFRSSSFMISIKELGSRGRNAQRGLSNRKFQFRFPYLYNLKVKSISLNALSYEMSNSLRGCFPFTMQDICEIFQLNYISFKSSSDLSTNFFTPSLPHPPPTAGIETKYQLSRQTAYFRDKTRIKRPLYFQLLSLYPQNLSSHDFLYH